MSSRHVVAAVFVALVSGAGSLVAQQAAETPAALYGRQCASCHGATGTPNAAMARSMGIPDFADAHGVAAKPDAELQAAVTAGKGKMPAYRSRLTADQVRQLVTYIKTLKH